MDYPLVSKPSLRQRHLSLQTAIDALIAMIAVSLLTLVGVEMLSRFSGIPSPATAILAEQLRWFLPTFLYIWIMFYMIEVARR